MLWTLLQDLRYTVRQLRRSPFFSLTVMATLALSIGATAAMVGVLRATLLNPLPYPAPAQLVTVSDTNLKGFASTGLTAVLRVDDLARFEVGGHRLFSSTAYFYADDSALTLPGQTPIRVPVTAASGGFFNTLGAASLLGRTLQPADDVQGGPQTVVLSYTLWQTVFAADPAILGRVVRLGQDQATVIGVMPRGFDLPAGTQVWHPSHIFPTMFGGYRGDGSRFLQVIARLSPGIGTAAAQQAVSTLGERLRRAYPASDAAWGFTLTGLRDSLFGRYREALVLLAAAVGLVLLVAAVNLAGLQLSRNATRVTEFGIRGALGVSRGRLVRQLVTESLTLVLAGSLVGVGLAVVMLHALASRLPHELVQVAMPHVDAATLLISFAAAVLIGVGTAVLPALNATRAQAVTVGRTVGPQGRNAARFGRVFTAAQIALALVLLTLSAAVLQSLYRLLTTPLGFETAHRVTFTVDLPWGLKTDRVHRLYEQSEAAIAALPGVESVGLNSGLPLSGYSFRRTYDIVGQPPTPQGDAVVAEGRTFTPNYLATMHIPLLAGRNLTTQDGAANAPAVLLVNQAFATRYYSASTPVGVRLKGQGGPLEIVGVVGNVLGTTGSLDKPVQPELYSIEDGGWPHMQFVLRTSLPAATLEPAVRRIVTGFDPAASPGHFSTFDAQVTAQLRQPRLNASLLSAFAGLSLLLVVLGVYGLVAFEVSQRTRELGLRLALGSTRGGVLRLLLGQSARMLAAGLAAGVAGSLLARRLLTAHLSGTTNASPALLAGLCTVLASAVLASTFFPARRAAHLDPMHALKAE